MLRFAPPEEDEDILKEEDDDFDHDDVEVACR